MMMYNGSERRRSPTETIEIIGIIGILVNNRAWVVCPLENKQNVDSGIYAYICLGRGKEARRIYEGMRKSMNAKANVYKEVIRWHRHKPSDPSITARSY